MRLAKHLAHSGVASRRAAEAMIAAGRVTVAGETVTDPARDVSGAEAIAVDGTPLGAPPRLVVYAVHKPAGVVSTAHDPHGRPTVVELVPEAGTRLYPVGRLDADTTGLILLTNDGALANHLTHPRYEVPKTYRAKVASPPVAERALQRLRDGVELDDGPTAPAQVRRLRPDVVELTIREGRKRQVRRMCEAIGHPVLALRRVAFGPLALGDLPAGAHRRLSAAEVERLRAAAARPRPAPPSRPAAAPPRPPRARRAPAGGPGRRPPPASGRGDRRRDP
jgi:23S rRNA pseudouridine2605 synthase